MRGSMRLFTRTLLSAVGAALITIGICVIAPMISHEQRQADARTPQAVAILPPPPLEQPEKIQKVITPRNPLQLPRPAPQKPPPPQPRIEQVPLAVNPLAIELPPLRVAKAPIAPPAPQPEVAHDFGDNNIYDLSTVDTPPQLQRYIPPAYPASARGRGLEGKVVVRCIVTANGRVESPEILSAAPAGYFEKAALKAVSRWTFIAAKLGGKNVPVYVDIPLSFVL